VEKRHKKFTVHRNNATQKYYQSLYYPTNAYNIKNVELLKHIKITEAAPTCFGLQKTIIRDPQPVLS